MSKQTASVNHQFTQSEIHYARHLLEERIIKDFGEVWKIKEAGNHLGVTWDCGSPLLFDNGIWKLCQTAKHRGAKMAAGYIEVRDAGHVIRFIIFYERMEEKTDGKRNS